MNSKTPKFETARENVVSEPQQMLRAGVEILDDLMRSHGFVYTPTTAGVGSGGPFAAGEFRRLDRRLELHYRYSLGLVTYHVGQLTLSHEDYMWSVIGQRRGSHYPGFSKEPLDGFRELLADLNQYCGDFLAGTDADFAAHVELAEELKKRAPRLP
jgi:hypothetical protein